MPEVNLFVIGDPGYKVNVLERHVAEAMDLYRSGQLPLSDGSAIALDAVVMTGDNFETDDQSFEDAVKPQFEEAFAMFDVPFYITLGNHDFASPSKAEAEWKYAEDDEDEGGSPRWTVGSDFSFRHYRVDLPSPDTPLVTLIELDSNGAKQVKQGAAFLQQQLDAIDQERKPRWVAVFSTTPSIPTVVTKREANFRIVGSHFCRTACIFISLATIITSSISKCRTRQGGH